MLEEKLFETVKYLVSYPEDFCEDRKYPLIVFLHGAGTRGQQTDILRRNACFLNLKQRQNRGYILLAPQCSVTNWNEVMSSLIGLVEHMRNQAYVDSKRVYLTGNSMGGYGTWELSSLRPDWFAAIMPICGGGIPWMTRALVDIPVRSFHGLCDTVVDPVESLEMVKSLNQRGGHGELILFPKLEHNCWDKVYTTEENYDWLLSFTTDRDRTLVEQISGAYYG